MRLLLDTHIFLWSLLEPERLRPEVVAALEDKSNELWLSPIVILLRCSLVPTLPGR